MLVKLEPHCGDTVYSDISHASAPFPLPTFVAAIERTFNHNMKRIILLLAAALQTVLLFAQATPPDTLASSKHSKKHAHNLLEAFEHGHFHGNFRTFLMATDNTRQLSDYHAWAAGGGLHFSSAPWHGVSFGIGGLFNYNLASSDLGAKDSITGAANHYEIGLFDVQDPQNKKNLDRIKEL
jgi:hypothetical protein